MRTLSVLAAGLVAIAFSQAAWADEAPARPLATLKAAARVDGPQVLVGDLFDGADGHAAEPVAAAPPPGGTMMFTAAWLTAIARAHGLSWQPSSPAAAIRLDRAAIEVTTDDVAHRLALALDIDRPDRRIVLDNGVKLYAPTGAAPEIGVEHLAFDRETNRVSADIQVPADDPSARRVHVSGRVDTMIELAVLGRGVVPGDLIRAEDVSTDWVRLELAPTGGISDPRFLVGKTPRRPIRANAPLRAGDVEVPIVIKRNDAVLIVLERPGMYLTAQGKALEDGGEGSVIRVANGQSNRAIDAVVMGAGRVAVAPASVAQVPQ